MSIWQTKKWWEMLIKSNQAEKVFDIDWVFIEKRKVAMWEYWLFALWLEKEVSKKNVEKLIKLCKKENALFLQIETLSYTSFQPYPLKEKEQDQSLTKDIFYKWEFKKWYYKKFITPFTAVIDLEKSEDEILASMKPKGRYNIKVARKNEVEVKKVEKTDENIELYYNLMLETTSRDWFAWNSLDYYKTFLNTLKNSKLLLAFKENKVIAWWIFTFDKEVSIYYYWASTSDKKYRNLMAPYLLQWTAIEIAKEKWSKIYDFLWVATPWEKYSSLAWVTDFKIKLSKDIREVSYSYIYINKTFKYCLINILRKIKK